MAITKLVTQADIVAAAFADNNLYTQYIKDDLIITAQLSWLRVKIGKDYYNEIINQVDAGTLTDANSTAYNDLIKPALCWYVAYSAVPFLEVKINNTGAVNNFFDTGRNAEPARAETTRSSYLSIAESYLDALIDLMTDIDNQADYPTYNSRTDESANITEPEYLGGIIIDRTNYITHKGECDNGYTCENCGRNDCGCYGYGF